MPRQFSDGHHIGCFLKLDGLRVDEFAFIVYDDPGVETAVVLLVDVLAVGTGVSSDSLGDQRGRVTYKSHRRGKPLASLPIPAFCLIVLVLRQPLHWMKRDDAREESWEALMTIPGSRTSFVSVLACTG